MQLLYKYRFQIFFLALFTPLLILLFIAPIPQDPSYHSFGDKRTMFSISNFWNVTSNVPMFFLGITGMYLSTRNIRFRPDLTSKLIPIFLSLGIFAASFGSAYYHYEPNNNTLVWDRLPMTLMFMPLFSLIVYDFIGAKAGKWAFLISVPLGLFSVLYWAYTELLGYGDLRLYGVVQFLPMLLAPIIIILFPKKVPYLKHIILILIWYAAAKISEHFDMEIFEFLGFWSGHTIKHLLGAISLYYVLYVIVNWEKTLIIISPKN